MNVLSYTPLVRAHEAGRSTGRKKSGMTSPSASRPLTAGTVRRPPPHAPGSTVEVGLATHHSSHERDEAGWGIDRLVNAQVIADLLGVHPNYVYDLAAKGDLPSYKFGGVRRFDLAEIRVWLSNQRNGPDLAP